jgi:hypothetical protein
MKNFFSDPDFVYMMESHIKNSIALFMDKGIFFSILVNIGDVKFDPKLPKNISSTFKPITLFALAGYSFESLEILEEGIVFEAGFGSENFGSIVNIPYSSIIQILIDDTPVLINLSRKVDVKKQKSKVERSKNIFLSNPENKHLL